MYGISFELKKNVLILIFLGIVGVSVCAGRVEFEV